MIFPVILIYFLLSSIILICIRKKDYGGSFPLSTLFLTWGILLVIATFRSPDMPDYQNYYDYFVHGNFERGEIAFRIYTEGVKSIVSNPIFIFASVALLSIGLKLLAIRRLSPFFWGSLLIYVAHFFILHDMIQIRAAISSGLLLWTTRYLANRNAKKFFLLASVALLFHNSALAIFPLWFINTTKLQKKIYLLMIPVAYMLAIGGITFGHMASYIPIDSFQSLWRMYQISMENDVGVDINLFNVMLLIRCCVCMYILFMVDKIAKRNTMIIIWSKIYTISLVALLLLSDIPVIAFRISELYQIVEILLIPSLVLMPRYKQVNSVVMIVFAGCCLFINIFYNQYLL